MKVSNHTSVSKNNALLFFSLIITFYIIVFWPNITNPFFVYSDIAVHYFIDYVFNNSLFQEDPFVEYSLRVFNIQLNSSNAYFLILFNWYYSLLSLLSLLMPTYQWLKLFSFFQYLLTGLLLFLLINSKNKKTILPAIALTFPLLFLSMDTYQGGLPRGFGIPFFLFSLLCSKKMNKRYISILLITVAFTYPQLLPCLVLFFLILSFKSKVPVKTVGLIFALILFFSAIFISCGTYISDAIFSSSNRAAYSSYKTIIDFSQTPFLNNLYFFLKDYCLNAEDHSKEYVIITFFYIFLSLFSFKSWPKHVLKYPWIKSLVLLNFISLGLLLASLILGLLLNETTFFLHLGAKSLKYNFPLLLCILSAISIHSLIRSKTTTISAVTLLIICFQLLYQKTDCTNYSQIKPFVKLICEIPDDHHLLANPKDAEYIPLYCSKKSYWMYIWTELSGKPEFRDEVNRRKLVYDLIPNIKDKEKLKSLLIREKIHYTLLNFNKPIFNIETVNNIVKESKAIVEQVHQYALIETKSI